MACFIAVQGLQRQGRAETVVREARVHRRRNHLGVARRKVEHLRERVARDDGKPEAVERRRLHFLAAFETDEFVARSADERLPEAAHVHSGEACIGNREERGIHADALQNGFGLHAVASGGLADRTDPARKDAVAQGQMRIIIGNGLSLKRQRKANLFRHFGGKLL